MYKEHMEIKFVLHSLCSGGASTAVNVGMPDMRHGTVRIPKMAR
jgi:hypothetical protein